MSVIGGALQQPDENLDYDIDYTEFLNEGDTLASVTAEVTPITDDPLQANAALVTGTNRVKVWVYGGLSDHTYKVEVTTDTAGGRRKQDEFEVYIEEI